MLSIQRAKSDQKLNERASNGASGALKGLRDRSPSSSSVALPVAAAGILTFIGMVQNGVGGVCRASKMSWRLRFHLMVGTCTPREG